MYRPDAVGGGYNEVGAKKTNRVCVLTNDVVYLGHDTG